MGDGMKRIKIALVTLMLTLSTSLFAISSDAISQAGFGDLTEQQQAEIIKAVADKKAQATEVTTVDEAQKWVNLGASIGKGLAGSAKELGIAVNDFAQTDVGKITTLLIIYQVIGEDLVDIAGGLLFIIVGFSAITYMFRRAYPTDYEYYENGKVKSKRPRKPESDAVGGWVVTYIAILLVGVLLIVI
jgi:hypothetical protein